jgi:hypothetical protein
LNAVIYHLITQNEQASSKADGLMQTLRVISDGNREKVAAEGSVNVNKLM